MNETIVSDKPSISQSGKAMIVFNSINKNKKNLKFLGKSLENIDMILTQITEFKKHNITVEMLKNAYEKIDNEYLKIKLEDMIILYEDMQDKIGDNFIDENDMLTILADNIEKSHLFDNAVFYIDEFAGFTKQEYSVIEKINEIASEVFVTVCTDELKIYKAPEADVFYDNKQTVQTLVSMFDLEKANQIKLEKNYRFKNEELKHLEKNIFSIPYNQYDEECKNIKLTLADNNYEEIEYVASEIIKLVKNENYRYRDIAVISNNTESYNGLCKAIFGEYNIPVFIDEKIDITQNVLIKYVLSIIDILAKNWSYESVFNYLKTGLVDVDNLYELEKYCLKWGIKGKKWYEKPWDYEEENYNNDIDFDQL
jgi:ATP-dependent helicase/nuclease subunit B